MNDYSELRAKHWKNGKLVHRADLCPHDFQPWPCETARLLDEVERLRAALDLRDAVTEVPKFAYVTWDQAVEKGRVSHAPDGYPDIKIIPLVRALRRVGIITTQSCYGHPGHSDGCLWIAAGTLSPDRALRVDRTPFSEIKRQYQPNDVWEFWWNPSDAGRATVVLAALNSSTGQQTAPVAGGDNA